MKKKVRRKSMKDIGGVIELDEVRGTEGDWVVIVRGKVVASEKDSEKIFEIARDYLDEKDVVVTKILSTNASFY